MIELLIMDFETQLETTIFGNEEAESDSYFYMLSVLETRFKYTDILTLRQLVDIFNILDDIEKYTLKEAYEKIIEYLEEIKND